MPGGERVGFIVTTLLGIGGALLGGFLATALGLGDPIDEFFDLSTWVAAIVGALVILFAWNARQRPANGIAADAARPSVARDPGRAFLSEPMHRVDRRTRELASPSSSRERRARRVRRPRISTAFGGCRRGARGRRRPRRRVVPRLDRARRRRPRSSRGRRTRRPGADRAPAAAPARRIFEITRSIASFRSRRRGPALAELAIGS